MTINQAFFQVVRWRQPPGLRLTALPAGRSFSGTALMFSFYRRLCRVNGRWLKVIRILLLFKQGNRELKRLCIRTPSTALSWGIAHCRNVSRSRLGIFLRLCIGVYCQYAAIIATGVDDFSAFASVVATLITWGQGLAWLLITLPV